MRIRDVFGLSPLGVRANETLLALRGGPDLPKTRYGLSSLSTLHPALSVKTWLGLKDRRLPISNLFNRTQTPLTEGWSVRKTQVRDFRGGQLTYDSHNGVDFAIPIGTTVVAPAPGKVLRISSEFNRGGLKVFLDHGGCLCTTSNHLGVALVEVGETVRRGQPIALSAYSGLDGLVTFPWGVPHVHFNVWLDGEYVDPFAAPGEIALWRGGNDPEPSEEDPAEVFAPTAWDSGAVARAIAACNVASAREQIERETELDRRALTAMFLMNYYPTQFSERVKLSREVRERGPHLTLPFRREDYEGITFADETAK